VIILRRRISHNVVIKIVILDNNHKISHKLLVKMDKISSNVSILMILANLADVST
jgi:hypothetical protein